MRPIRPKGNAARQGIGIRDSFSTHVILKIRFDAQSVRPIGQLWRSVQRAARETEEQDESIQILERFEIWEISKPRSSMDANSATRTTAAFSRTSIEEVDTHVALSEFEQIDEQVALIESFSQPYPLRVRDKPVMDGEMDSYG
jgi:hypothetical protein